MTLSGVVEKHNGVATPVFDFGLFERLGVRLTKVTADSRQVRLGDTFLAYPGEQHDGRNYIAQAIAGGANAVLWESGNFYWNAEWQIPNFAIAGLRAQAGVIAAKACGNPSRQLWMIGITGTNGKTSCAHWLAQALIALGRKTAIIGTLGNGFNGALSETLNTTPDAIALHYQLRDYVAQGAQCVAMEVSSHGLAQGRVNGATFDIAVLTNLSRDHLDYHGNMENYAAAKAGLFVWPGLKSAVLNMDDEFGTALARELSRAGGTVLGYGFEAGDVRGENLQVSAAGLNFDVRTPWGAAHVQSALLGRFNASNLLAVLAVLLASNVTLADAVAVLAQLKPVAGRMQQLNDPGKPLVVVDYAHTPDALEKVLSTLREVVAVSGVEKQKPKLICVFGCGGKRDRGKRPLMGETVSRLADSVVVTSDNPRNESPREIIDEIVAGMGANYHIIEDRAAAIDYAIRHAHSADVVLIAGKGHEQYQEIDGVKLPFSDVEVAQRALQGVAPC